MGMYDSVNVVIDCPSCGEKLGGFQSKSGDCLLELLKPDDVDNFYSYCECGTEVVFNRPAKKIQVSEESPPDTLDTVLSLGFTMQTTTKEERQLKYKEFQDKMAAMKGIISFPFKSE